MLDILIVDDEVSITTLIDFHLQQEGYRTTLAHDGQQAWELLTTAHFDFIVLDVMLPGINGFDLVKKMRQRSIETPVLLLTAKDDLVDKILGLEFGADDYMTKPFSPKELLTRIKVILRRLDKTQQTEKKIGLKFGSLEVYPDTFEVYKEGALLDLTRKEFELLLYFMERPDRIIDRETLIRQLWDDEIYENTRVIDIHISHLREKIEDDPKTPNFLLTVRGFGYKMTKQGAKE